jgi:hypothetical protein
LQDPAWKKNLDKKRAGGVAQGKGPEFKAQYHKKKKKKEKSLCKSGLCYILNMLN